MFTLDDHRYMARAIELARRGLYTTDPNPRVGCVLVQKTSDSDRTQIVGEGWHEQAGQGHAEVRALADAGPLAKGAVAYVTLEPCSHFGKTGPCAQALIDAGVSQVFAAMKDPNPRVAGTGIQLLEDAGIPCVVGLLEQESRKLNPGFIQRMVSGKPWVRIKLAMSLDGRTAMANGESQWITGPAARLDVQKYRARSSAIITGVNTIIDDDASLTVRAEMWSQSYFHADSTLEKIRQPRRIILDSSLRTPVEAKILKQLGQTIIVASESAAKADQTFVQRQQQLEDKGAKVVVLNGAVASPAQHTVSIDALLDWLAREQCNEVLVEAGPTLAGAFYESMQWDELQVYIAPTLMGSEGRPLMQLPLQSMSQIHRFQWQEVCHVGSDLRCTLLRNDGFINSGIS